MRTELFKDKDLTIFTESDHSIPNCGAPLLGVEYRGETNFYTDDEVVNGTMTARALKDHFESLATNAAASNNEDARDCVDDLHDAIEESRKLINAARGPENSDAGENDKFANLLESKGIISIKK